MGLINVFMLFNENKILNQKQFDCFDLIFIFQRFLNISFYELVQIR